MIINVDCDGVLVPNRHENLLTTKIETEGYSYSDTSPIWDWYDELIHTQPLPVNVPLLTVLRQWKDNGHVLRLWTNRGYTLKSATLENLGGWKHLFDSTTFYGGRKHESRVEGLCIDNHARYLSCGQFGWLYPEYA